MGILHPLAGVGTAAGTLASHRDELHPLGASIDFLEDDADSI